MDYGILSLVPPVVAIILALRTKQTILSLFVGIWAGSTIINNWNPLVGFARIFTDCITPQIADPFNAAMLVLFFMSGGFVYLMRVSGGADAIGELAGRKIKSRRNAQTITWLSSFAFFYTEPCLLQGTIMRPLTDRFKVSRVKLAYILDSMGCSVASISPINDYAPFIVGLVSAQFVALGLTDNPWGAYFKMIPFNLYGIFAMLSCLFIIRTGLDIGKMYNAEMRAINTGELLGKDDIPIVDDEVINFEGKNISIKNFVIPMVALLGSIFIVIFWTGNIFENGFRGSFLNADILLAMTLGYLNGAIAAALVGVSTKLFNFSEALDYWVQGVKNIMIVPIIVVLAWSIGGLTGTMNVQGFLAGYVAKLSNPGIIPALIFLIGCAIAFATGSSWGVWTIMIPIAIPIAHSFGLSMPFVLGAVISGGLFGDHCSPISDTTIMSSTGAACDHIEHVRTQLPYALIVGGSAFIGFLIGGLTGVPILSVVATAILIVLTFYLFHKRSKKISDVQFKTSK